MKYFPRLRYALGALLLGVALSAPALPLTQISSPATAMAHPARSGLADLVGDWHNVNGNTDSIVRIVVFQLFGATYAHNYGACTPTPCNWGIRQVTGFSVGTDIYIFNFATKVQTLYRVGPYLRVLTYTHFTDNSGRQDYRTLDTFYRG